MAEFAKDCKFPLLRRGHYWILHSTVKKNVKFDIHCYSDVFVRIGDDVPKLLNPFRFPHGIILLYL